MPYPNEHACRLQDPGKYPKIKRVNCARRVSGKCLDIIYGILGRNQSEEQAYRYDKKVWTKEQARNHCKRHEGTFDAAAD